MTILKNSLSTSRSEPTQLPLKGFIVEIPDAKKGWKVLHEGMGEGRMRVHLVRIEQ